MGSPRQQSPMLKRVDSLTPLHALASMVIINKPRMIHRPLHTLPDVEALRYSRWSVAPNNSASS
jgi:hypothetical protein